jgi:AhpD family alkylhydroperoxidase
MKARLNPYRAAPEAMKTLAAVQDYVQQSGLEPSLVDLVRTRASQINGCAYCIHLHTRDTRARRERGAALSAQYLARLAALHGPRARGTGDK